MGAVLVGVVIVIAIIAAAVGGGGDDPEPAPRRSSESGQASQPRATPRPAETAAACPTSAERRYLARVAGVLGRVVPAMGNLGSLFVRAGEDATLVLDDDWRADLLVELVILQAGAEELRGLSAPTARTRSLEGTTGAMARELEAAVANTAAGVDDFDIEALERAARSIERVGQLAEDGAAALDAVCP